MIWNRRSAQNSKIKIRKCRSFRFDRRHEQTYYYDLHSLSSWQHWVVNGCDWKWVPLPIFTFFQHGVFITNHNIGGADVHNTTTYSHTLAICVSPWGFSLNNIVAHFNQIWILKTYRKRIRMWECENISNKWKCYNILCLLLHISEKPLGFSDIEKKLYSSISCSLFRTLHTH